MPKRTHSLLLALLLIALHPASSSVCAPDDHPRIALVLGGGGAKGIAHLGILKVLEEEHVPVDFVVGTSMGAIVGGLYASGMPIDQLESTVSGLDWSEAFSDAPSRKTRSFRRKQDERDFLIKARLRLQGTSLQIPPGVLPGRRALYLLRELVGSANTVEDFNDLALPFRAVATDLITGETVVLDSGDLAMAMRASMSVPGFFYPIEIDGRLLVDGFVSQNLPVSVAEEDQPDVIIAVDLGGKERKQADDIGSALSVLDQVMDIFTRRQTERDMALLGDDDVLLLPDMKGIESTSFGAAEEAIPRGVQAADSQREALRALGVSAVEWARYDACRTRQEPPAEIVEVKVETDTLDERFISLRLANKIGRPLDYQQLQGELERIYGLDLFETVDYDLIERPDGQTLIVTAPARHGGTNFLRLGLDLADDFDGDTAWNIGVRYTATQLNRHGLEVRSDIRLGNEQDLNIEAYQPFRASPIFVAPRIGLAAADERAFSEGVEVARYRAETGFAALDIGSALHNWGEVRLGYSYDDGYADRRVGPPELESFDFIREQAYLRLAMDSLDNPNFPHDGTTLDFGYERRFEDIFDDRTTDVTAVDWASFGRVGRLSFGGGFEGGTVIEDDHDVFPFRLGGLFRLSGLARDELAGRHYGLGLLVAYYEISGGSVLLDMPIYVGVSAEAGNVWQERDDAFKDLIFSSALFLGIDSVVGPVMLGAGFAEQGRRNYYFVLGRRF